MKNLTITIFVVCALIIGYLVGNLYPLLVFRSQQADKKLSARQKAEIIKLMGTTTEQELTAEDKTKMLKTMDKINNYRGSYLNK